MRKWSAPQGRMMSGGGEKLIARAMWQRAALELAARWGEREGAVPTGA
jgi:hypothetical protein